MNAARRNLLRVEVPFAALGIVVVACALTFSITGIPRWIPPALVVRAGIPSPLSGMTRSFVALASGEIGAAFAWHPLGPLVFGICVAMPVIACASWLRGRRFAVLTSVASAKATWIAVSFVAAAVWARQIVVL